MTDWGRAQLRVYDGFGRQIYYSEDIVEAQGNRAWHEIGRGASVTVPFIGTNADFIFDRDRRVTVMVSHSQTLLTHVVADFIIESTSIEEHSFQDGGSGTVIKASGRDAIKELGEIPARLRHISKYRIGRIPTSIGKTTLQMDATDTATYASMSLVGWTVELADGNWSEITAHTAGGLLTIDPAWQVNADDEAAAAPAPQKFYLYGAAFTETTGNYTDVKLALRNVLGTKNGWGLYGYESTANGSFVAPGQEASILKALQFIAAQSGEYFVRSFEGFRRIQWRREVPALSHPQYGYPLNLVVNDNYNAIREAVILPGARLSYDANERVTRVKPTGSGSGDKAVTLRDLPPGFSVAAGYSIDGEYLVYTAGETSGYAARDLRLDGIGPASDSAASRQLAARALYNAALLWLREHNDERLNLECEVLSAVPIEPVTYVYVTNPDYALANTLMYVLDVTMTYRDGMLLYKLQLSNKKAPILTDERLLAEAIRQTDRQLFYTNAPARNSRSLDRSKSGGSGGGSDHEPVTAGNAAINVATGQVVSLQLAGPSGLEVAGTGLRLADTVAGDGLGISNKILSLNVGATSGLLLSADSLSMGTPGALSATSTNQLQAGSHTHAVTATDNAKTTVGTLLKGSAAGDLGLRWLTADKAITPRIESAGSITLDPATSLIFAAGNLSFVGARQIVTDSGSLTLAPAQSLIIDPPDNVAQINSAVTLKTAHWASGFLGTGWGLTYDGVFDARQITADELHVAAFIADTARVKVGSLYVTPSVSLLSRNFTIPAVSASGTLYVEDAPGLEDMPLFADNDWLMLSIIDRTGGGLKVAKVWGQVAGYANLSGGEQSWTFTTRQSASTGQIFRRGEEVLCFGKSGDGWVWMTTLDAAGSPYLGITTWQGANPYTDGNRTHRLRLGQLKGVSGVNEWGLQAGTAPGSYIRFTDIRNEIHGTRLSLYAGDGAQLRVTLASVAFYRTAGQFNTLSPDSDSSSLNATTTEGTFWQAINGAGASKYVTNAANLAGYVSVGLSNPTTFSSIHHVDLSVTFTATGFSNDTARVYGQVFESDEITPLTGELLLLQRSSNTSNQVVTVTLPHDAAATKAKWDGAKLRLRWEYDIAANQEAIRLDPSVPSLAIGNPLPTGPYTGGAGLWVGRDSDGLYKFRLGTASGAGLRWSGSGLHIMNAAGESAIAFRTDGTSRFEGPMTIGAAGGIWQGTGTFAAPTTGLRIWNDGGVGRLATYNAGLEQVSFDTTGQLVAGAGTVKLNRAGMTISSGGNISFLDHNNAGMGHINYSTSGGDPSVTFKLYGGDAETGIDLFRSTGTNRVTVLLYANKGSQYTGFKIDTLENKAKIYGVGLAVQDYGIVLGNAATPPDGILRFKERTGGVGAPPAATGDLYVVNDGSKQILYFRFANGALRELARST